MEEIKAKIKQLLLLSSTEPKEGKDYWDNLTAKMQQQEKMWEELKVLAKANNTILGRIMRFQHADSYAYYLITKINKSTVRLDWLNYCDAWVDDRCGYACNMSLSYATQQIKQRDALDDLFSEHRRKQQLQESKSA